MLDGICEKTMDSEMKKAEKKAEFKEEPVDIKDIEHDVNFEISKKG